MTITTRLAAPDYARQLIDQLGSFGDAPAELAQLATSGVGEVHAGTRTGLLRLPLDRLNRSLVELATVQRDGERYIGAYDVAVAGVRDARERVLDTAAKVQTHGAGVTVTARLDAFTAQGPHRAPVDVIDRSAVQDMVRQVNRGMRAADAPGSDARIAAAIAKYEHVLTDRSGSAS